MRLGVHAFQLLTTVLLALFGAQYSAYAQGTTTIPNRSTPFVENKGQWDSRARFLLRTNGLDVWITSRGVLYDLYRLDCNAKVDAPSLPMMHTATGLPSITRRSHVVGISFEGASFAPEACGSGRLPGHHNYIIGNDPAKWGMNAALYRGAHIANLYDGISAEFYLDNGMPRYDLIVQPGADPAQIRMKVEGAGEVIVSQEGVLTMATSLGTLEQRDLYAYQVVEGVKQQVTCRFIVEAGNSVRFDVGNYDRTRPLVVDPLIWSSSIAGYDKGYSVAVDGSGSAFVAGSSESPDYPVTTGPYDISYNDNIDAVVTKMNETGSALVYSTFIGGNGEDEAYGIAIDAGGNACITGTTKSSDYPVTAGSYDVSYNGQSDVFVTKLNSAGNLLIYSTFVGGKALDDAKCIALDADGSAFITGLTSTKIYTPDLEYPTTVGAYDTSPGSNFDVFVTKLNPNGSALLYSTFIGGTRTERGESIAVDAAGNAYVTGIAISTTGFSSDYPTTPGAYDTTPDKDYDIFVTKLNPNGSGLVYSTFIAGNRSEYGIGIAVDGGFNAYVTGYTESSNYPTTPGAYDRSQGGGTAAFVTKLNPTGSGLVYSTFLGSGSGQGIAIDASGNAFIAGETSSPNFPTTPGSYDTSFNSAQDGFVIKLSADASTLLYSTFLGGSSFDSPFDIAIDPGGNAYVTGYTGSPDYPVTPGAYDLLLGSPADGFVTKLNVTGGALAYSTFLGGEGKDPNSGVGIDLTQNSAISSLALHLNAPVPNPSRGTMQFDYALDLPGEASATLYDVRGTAVREVFPRRRHAQGHYRMALDVADLPGGYYMLLLCGDGGCVRRPVIIGRF